MVYEADWKAITNESNFSGELRALLMSQKNACCILMRIDYWQKILAGKVLF